MSKMLNKTTVNPQSMHLRKLSVTVTKLDYNPFTLEHSEKPWFRAYPTQEIDGYTIADSKEKALELLYEKFPKYKPRRVVETYFNLPLQ